MFESILIGDAETSAAQTTVETTKRISRNSRVFSRASFSCSSSCSKNPRIDFRTPGGGHVMP
jgi:hypothetical protein